MTHPLTDTCTTTVEQYRTLRRLAEQAGTTSEALARRFVLEGMERMEAERMPRVGYHRWYDTQFDSGPLKQDVFVEPWPGFRKAAR